MLVPWMGGASSPPAAVSGGGVASMLAFWMGGASALVGDAPPVPEIPVARKVAGDDRRRSRDENDLLTLLQFLIHTDIL